MSCLNLGQKMIILKEHAHFCARLNGHEKFQTNPLKDEMRVGIRQTRNKILARGRTSRLNAIHRIVSVSV